MSRGLLQLDVGCGRNKRPGFVGVDRHLFAGVDVVHDLNRFPWPFADNSAGEIVLDNVLEHLPDTVGTMNELHRIAAPGSRVQIEYPYWRSLGAYGDPTHVRHFNEFMIDYFLEPGSSERPENKFAFYTTKYWRLISRDLISYPVLEWLPQVVLRNVSRQLFDIVHGVRIVITPDK